MRTICQCYATVVVFLLLSHATLPVIAQTSRPPTQGQFAVKLAEELGLGGSLSEQKAVELLSSLSIRPVLPRSRDWKIDEPAEERFVASIQASIQTLLKRVATSLGIVPPPTLELFIFEVPPAPQHVYFHQDRAEAVSRIGAEAAPAGPSFPYEPPTAPTDQPKGQEPSLRQAEPVSSASDAPGTVDAFVAEDPESQDVIADLQARLGKGERPAVIVALRQPGDLPPGLDRLRLINDVLDILSDSEFELKRKHESVPGFSGFLLEGSALEKLRSDGRVERIQPDALAAPQ